MISKVHPAAHAAHPSAAPAARPSRHPRNSTTSRSARLMEDTKHTTRRWFLNPSNNTLCKIPHASGADGKEGGTNCHLSVNFIDMLNGWSIGLYDANDRVRNGVLISTLKWTVIFCFVERTRDWLLVLLYPIFSRESTRLLCYFLCCNIPLFDALKN